MIGIPLGVRVWLVAGHTDMRRGFEGIGLQVVAHQGAGEAGQGLQARRVGQEGQLMAGGGVPAKADAQCI